jgi:hypothetical protein
VLGETVIAVLEDPVDQEYVPPPEAVSVVFPPAQMLVFPVMLGVSEDCTVTTTVLEPGPQGVVAVTTYVVVLEGFATGFEILGLLRPVVGDQV